MYIQVMTFEEAEKFRWNPFDLTKVLYVTVLSFAKINECLVFSVLINILFFILDLATFWISTHSSWQDGSQSQP